MFQFAFRSKPLSWRPNPCLKQAVGRPRCFCPPSKPLSPSTLPPPSERVLKVLEGFKQLNFIEIMALGKELQKITGVTDEQLYASCGSLGPPPGGYAQAPAAAAPAAEAAPAAAAAPAKEQKILVADIKLISFPEANKFQVLKEIRKLKPGMNLLDSKKLIEELPGIVGKKIHGEELEEWKKMLEAAGAKYELVPAS